MHDIDMPTQIDAMQLAPFLPHSGPMVLLHKVVHWDDASILCVAISHLDPNNPLRVDGQLSSVQTIEYAAQAVSLHTALNSLTMRKKPVERLAGFKAVGTGYLAIVRDFELVDANLGDFTEPYMEVSAQAFQTGPRIMQYRVKCCMGELVISAGLITLVVEN